MTSDYRIQERHLKRFLSRLWKGDVLQVYHNILIANPNVKSEQFLEGMKLVVYNDSHVVAMRDRVYGAAVWPRYQGRRAILRI
jgi:hypothetical protein